MPTERVFVLVLIELSEQLAIHLPEQQNSVTYKIKQEERTEKDRESKVNVLQCLDTQ